MISKATFPSWFLFWDINAIRCDTEVCYCYIEFDHCFSRVNCIGQDVWFPSRVDYFNDVMKFDTIDLILRTIYRRINDNKNNNDLDLYLQFYLILPNTSLSNKNSSENAFIFLWVLFSCYVLICNNILYDLESR